MKLGEYLGKIFGVDMNQEYIAEQVQNFPAAMNPPAPEQQIVQQQGSTVEQQPPVQTTTQQVVQQVQQNNDSAVTIQQLQAEIESLKKANNALLSQTPIATENLSVEDMIYRTVVGTPST